MAAVSGKPVLVIGGGIAGLTTAIELADTGCRVVLVEKSASLGGRVARMHQYFPKLCPPSCGLEMHFRRLRDHAAIEVLTLAEVEQITDTGDGYEALVRIRPRYVSDKCTLCGACTDACPVERADEFNYGLSKAKAARLPYPTAFPARYVVDRGACRPDCKACVDACTYGAIDLSMTEQVERFQVSAIVAATGWEPYDARRIENLGFGRCANVVTNVLLERMAASDGPTGGRILRPSDGKEPRTVAFVQCAGSRDENHLPYCSAVCCSASMKQAAYIRALYPETAITVFYIDIRTPGRLEEFYTRVEQDASLRMIKGKVAKVEENATTGDLSVTAEDTLSGHKSTMTFEMVVLATGMVPQTKGLPVRLRRDDFGFLPAYAGNKGIYAAGCVRHPGDVTTVVQDATGMALHALQCGRRCGDSEGAHHA